MNEPYGRLFSALAGIVLLGGCAAPEKAPGAEKWLDYYLSDDMPWGAGAGPAGILRHRELRLGDH